MMFQVQARAIHNPDKLSRDVPTFYIDGNVQGVRGVQGAREVAHEIIDPFKLCTVDMHVIAVEDSNPQADHLADEVFDVLDRLATDPAIPGETYKNVLNIVHQQLEATIAHQAITAGNDKNIGDGGPADTERGKHEFGED